MKSIRNGLGRVMGNAGVGALLGFLLLALAAAPLSLCAGTPTPESAAPQWSFAAGTDGLFYGAQPPAGSSANGKLLKASLGGKATAVASLKSKNGTPPAGDLVAGTDGSLCGAASGGGSGQHGTVYRISTNGSATVLHAFTGGDDGGEPLAGLAPGPDGAFYGTASSGGAGGSGVLFRIGADGTFTVIHAFDGADGASPSSKLLAGQDGALYGTTRRGGDLGQGAIFRIERDGSGYQVIHSFAGNDGAYPSSSLVEDDHGMLFGVAAGGGLWSQGALFTLGCTGEDFAVIHDFGSPDPALADGTAPLRLSLADTGMVFGTTMGGGANGAGALFACAKDGADYSVVYSYTGKGDDPKAGYVVGDDGFIYGPVTAKGKVHLNQLAHVPEAACSTPSITTNPSDTTVCAGNNATFTAAATGYTSVSWEYKSGSCTGSGWTAVPSATTTTLTLTSVTAGMNNNYYRAVFLNNPGTCSPSKSNTSGCGILTVNSIPSDPTGTAATSNRCTDVQVTWNSVTGAASYNVLRAASCGGTATTFTGVTSPYNDTTAVAGTTYSYWVIAVNTCGSSSGVDCVTGVRATTPAAPANVAATTTRCNDVQVTWDAASGATSYNVLRSTTCGGTATTFTGVTSPYSDTTAVAGTTYSYWVVAVGCGSSASSCASGRRVLVTVSGTPPGGTVGTGYSYAFGASGGTASYTYAITAGTQPTNLTLSSGGVLSGTPSAAGTFNFTVTATDAYGCTGSQAYSVQICPAITLSPGTIPDATQGVGYSQVVSASGGANGNYGWALSSGAPPWMSLSNANNNTVTLTGTPTAGGPYTFTLTGTDKNGCSGSVQYTLKVCPTITVSPTTLPGGLINVSYSQSISSTGGAGTVTYSITSGTQPTGLGLSSGGVLSGTPSAAGLFNFTVTATDANGCTGSRSYSVRICPLITLTSSLPNGAIGTAYSQTITAGGGTGPYTYAITSGTQPTGLGLSSGGVLSGTPSTSTGSPFTFTVTATDANSCTGSQSYTISISCPTITVTPASLSAGTVGTAYGTVIFGASGGSGNYDWSSSGSPPPGMTLDFNGSHHQISGTPTSNGTYTFNVTATDHSYPSCSGTTSYSLTIDCPAITLSPSSLPNAVPGASYNQSVTASPSGTYAYAITSGSLPPNLNINAGTGAITGTVSSGASGDYPITVTATLGSSTCTGQQSYTIHVGCPTITVSPASLSAGTVGTDYGTVQFTATGGSGSYNFSYTGSVPPGMTLGTHAGRYELSGTPTANGTYSFTVTAQDATYACSGSTQDSLVINCPTITLTPASGSLPDGAPGATYNQAVSVSSPTGKNYAYGYAITSGAAPTGLSIDPSTGTISGTIDAAANGDYSFTVTATLSGSTCTGTANYTIHVACPTITVSPGGSLSAGSVGTDYGTVQFTATGGSGSYTFSYTGTLPAGMSIGTQGNKYELSGTPTQDGTFHFTVTASDQDSACAGHTDYTLNISCVTITLNNPLPDGVLGDAYPNKSNVAASPSGRNYTYTYAVASGTWPPGLSLDPNTGDVTGTPTLLGTFTFTVTASLTGSNCSGSQQYTVNVTCPVMDIKPQPNTTDVTFTGQVGHNFNKNFGADPSDRPFCWSWSGTLPQGLSFDGKPYCPPGNPYHYGLSGTPLQAGDFTFTVCATIVGTTCQTCKTFYLHVDCPSNINLPSQVPYGWVGVAYGADVSVQPPNDGPYYAYAVTDGSLPDGLTLDASAGSISGTPTTVGAFTFTITATGFGGCAGSQQYTLNICSLVCSAQLTPSLPQPTVASPVREDAPEAAAPSNDIVIPLGMAITFTGSSTLGGPCEGQDVTYNWDFGDGTTATGSPVDHTYQGTGYYTWTLTATAPHGGVCTETGHALVLSTNVSFYDDYGRSQFCINSVTGAYVWRILDGLWAGQVFQGVGSYYLLYDTMVFRTNIPADPNTIEFRYHPPYNKAFGYLTNAASNFASQLDDSNSTDDPACDQGPVD